MNDTRTKARKLTLYVSLLTSSSMSPLAFADTQTAIEADIWADNWFAMYIGDTLIAEDPVSINTERSFNAESFTFEANLPAELSFIIKDFKENDTGLEYIGSRKQQMGDGGFIAQFKQTSDGSTLLVSDAQWRCMPIHIAPLNKQCEKSTNPDSSCGSDIIQEPAHWKDPSYEIAQWPHAVEYSERSVRPKDGYDRIDWQADAQLIWTSDIETDNTILCRTTLQPSNQ